MGIMAPIARMLLKEHKRKPFSGKGLLIGRQTVPLSIEEAKSMIVEEGLTLRDVDAKLDESTVVGGGANYIEDVSFFSLFCDLELTTLDVTDYEGAEIVHDMHHPVPEGLHDQFDFIWNGSCLDNMFDPVTAMISTSKMLRKGGRMVCMEIASNNFDPYLIFSQSWFFDYFAINNFAYSKMYTLVFRPNKIWTGPYDVYVPRSYKDSTRAFPAMTFQNFAMLTFVIAEKDESTSNDSRPIQWQYRPDQETYIDYYEKTKNSDVMQFERTRSKSITLRSNWQYLGAVRGVPQKIDYAGLRRRAIGWIRHPLRTCRNAWVKLYYHH